MSKSIGLVAGSFDPPTIGHEDLIRRAAKMFDTLYVTVFVNPDKTPMFTREERKRMLEAALSDIPNVIFDENAGMLADYARERGIKTVVKGVRNEIDAEYERKMADFNKKLNPDLDTVLLPCKKELQNINSTEIRKRILTGGDISNLVSPRVNVLISKKTSLFRS